jgi:transposase InsO family protein
MPLLHSLAAGWLFQQPLRAIAPNQLWSWDITYLPTTVRGIWLYLYLVIDVWSRKVVAWDVAEREDPAIAADLVSRACLRERITATPCAQPRWRAAWKNWAC